MQKLFLTLLICSTTLGACLPSTTLKNLGMKPTSPTEVSSSSTKLSLDTFLSTCTKFYQDSKAKVCVDRYQLKSMVSDKASSFAEMFEEEQYLTLSSIDLIVEEYFAVNKEVQSKGSYNGKTVSSATKAAFNETNHLIEKYDVNPANAHNEVQACSKARQNHNFGLYCMLSSSKASQFLSDKSTSTSSSTTVNTDQSELDAINNVINPSSSNSTSSSGSDLDEFNALMDQAEKDSNESVSTDTGTSSKTNSTSNSDLDEFNAMMEEAQKSSTSRLLSSSKCPSGIDVSLNEYSINSVVGQCINSIKNICLFARMSDALAKAKGESVSLSILSKCKREYMQCSSKVPNSVGSYTKSNTCSNQNKADIMRDFFGGLSYHNFDDSLMKYVKVSEGKSSERRTKFYNKLTSKGFGSKGKVQLIKEMNSTSRRLSLSSSSKDFSSSSSDGSHSTPGASEAFS